MDIFSPQEYWEPGEEPTADKGWPTLRFKSFIGETHEICPLQDSEAVELFIEIYMDNVDYQKYQLEMNMGRPLNPASVLNLAAKQGWGPKSCAVYKGHKVQVVRASDIASLVTYAATKWEPKYTLFGIGLGKHNLDMYLARKCSELEAREIKQKEEEKAGKREPEDKAHHGGRRPHGGGRRAGEREEYGGLGKGGGGPPGAPPPGAPGPRGGRRGAKPFPGPRATPGQEASIEEAIRTINAGHWQQSKGPWAFGGVDGADGAGGGDEGGGRGRREGRRRPPAGGYDGRGARGGDEGRRGWWEKT